MGFKDLLVQDAKNVFLNREEFADTHSINGKSMPVLVDDNEILERDKSKLMNVTITGIYKERKLIYVATDDLGAKPAPDDLLNFDGAWYKVNDCTDEAGILCMQAKHFTTATSAAKHSRSQPCNSATASSAPPLRP